MFVVKLRDWDVEKKGVWRVVYRDWSCSHMTEHFFLVIVPESKSSLRADVPLFFFQHQYSVDERVMLLSESAPPHTHMLHTLTDTQAAADWCTRAQSLERLHRHTGIFVWIACHSFLHIWNCVRSRRDWDQIIRAALLFNHEEVETGEREELGTISTAQGDGEPTAEREDSG